MPKPIRRTLLLKRVAQVATPRYPQLKTLELHVQMDAVFKTATTVWDLHFPRKGKIEPGDRCIFFERKERKGKAVLFHAYSYVAGHTPDQVVFDDVKANISHDPIVTQNGNHKEIVERFAVMVLGEVMIYEAARVSGSGALAIHAMRDMIRRHVMPKHPNLRLEDAPTLEFKRMVKLHGGIAKVVARLNHSFAVEPNTFGSSMEKIVKERGLSYSKVTTTIEAPDNDELDASQVEAMLDEVESATGLSGISIQFRDDTSLGDLSKYREKRPIEVQQVRPGVPAVSEIENEIAEYLHSLIKPTEDNFQLINNSGQFT